MGLAPLPTSRRAADAEPHITSRTKLQILATFHTHTDDDGTRCTTLQDRKTPKREIGSIDSDRCRAAQATALAALQLRRPRPGKLRELENLLFFSPARARTFCTGRRGFRLTTSMRLAPLP